VVSPLKFLCVHVTLTAIVGVDEKTFAEMSGVDGEPVWVVQHGAALPFEKTWIT